MQSRGRGKRVRSDAPGIEGHIVVESASASLASSDPMSQQDRDQLMRMAQEAKGHKPVSPEQQAALDTAARAILHDQQPLLVRPRPKPVTAETLYADLHLLQLLESDQPFRKLCEQVALETGGDRHRARIIKVDTLHRLLTSG